MKTLYSLLFIWMPFAATYAECISDVAKIPNNEISIDIAPNLLNSSNEDLVDAVANWAKTCATNGGRLNAAKMESNQCLRLSCINVKQENMERIAQQAKEREQSLRNRLFSGAAIGLTGIGGMELLSGLAESNADSNAETDMNAYLATFRCEYGSNNVAGAVTETELPGANTLFSLYNDYMLLAADLKERKEVLGLTPGIESAVVLDKANTGLYDDQSSGIANGTFASLYRASQGNQNDIDKLNEQEQKTANKIKTGAVLTAAGIAVGILGNVLDEVLADNALDEDAEYDSDGWCINNCSGGAWSLEGVQQDNQRVMDDFIKSLKQQ